MIKASDATSYHLFIGTNDNKNYRYEVSINGKLRVKTKNIYQSLEKAKREGRRMLIFLLKKDSVDD